MSRFVDDRLPDALLARMSIDRAVENADHAVILCTSDEHGWPHPAMVSSLELIAVDARNLRLAVHHASRTARNLQANARVTLILADERGVFYIKGDALPIAPFLATDQDLAAFNVRVDSVLDDDPAAYEQARVVSGVRVEREARAEAPARLALLEEMAGAQGARGAQGA